MTQKQEKTEKISQPEPVKENISEEKEEEKIDTFTSETIIEEEKISSKEEQQEIKDEAALSFHETESFLPEITVQPNTDEVNIKRKQQVRSKVLQSLLRKRSSTRKKSLLKKKQNQFVMMKN